MYMQRGHNEIQVNEFLGRGSVNRLKTSDVNWI